MNGGFVYLIHAIGTDRYKIGITKELEKRFLTLNNASPYPLELVYYKYLDRYKEKETELHKVYAKKRVHLEWFELAGQDTTQIIEQLNNQSIDNKEEISICCFYGCKSKAPVDYQEFTTLCPEHGLAMYTM